MVQVTLRLDESLARRLKEVAAHRGQSVNAFASAVLGAVVDPDLAGDEVARLRERLDRAGLLCVAPAVDGPPADPDAVRAAGRRAARGRTLSDLVVEGRG